jgi:hypothetical protein
VAECGLPLLNHHGLLALAMRAATEEGGTL